MSTSHPRPIPFSLATVFVSPKFKNPPGLKAPKFNEFLPLSLFYHADECLRSCVKQLRKQRPGTIRFTRYLEKVHRTQKALLDSVHVIYIQLPMGIRSSREYRQILPAEDQRELEGTFSENILFAAQALARGYRVRGIEQYTDMLREPARQLCAALDALRYVFRLRALQNPHGPFLELGSVMKDYDWAWTRFEQRICFCYFSLSPARSSAAPRSLLTPKTVEEAEMFTVLLSETVMRGLSLNYFTEEEIGSCDPLLMFAIPRLAIVLGLLHLPHFIEFRQHGVSLHWFGRRIEELKEIQTQLKTLCEAEVLYLERMLLSSDTTSVEVSVIPRADLHGLFRSICTVADELQTGVNAREVVYILGRVFRMHHKEEEDKVVRVPEEWLDATRGETFPRSHNETISHIAYPLQQNRWLN